MNFVIRKLWKKMVIALLLVVSSELLRMIMGECFSFVAIIIKHFMQNIWSISDHMKLKATDKCCQMDCNESWLYVQFSLDYDFSITKMGIYQCRFNVFGVPKASSVRRTLKFFANIFQSMLTKTHGNLFVLKSISYVKITTC